MYPFRPQFFFMQALISQALRLITSSCTFLLPIQQQSSRINSERYKYKIAILGAEMFTSCLAECRYSSGSFAVHLNLHFLLPTRKQQI